MKKNYYLLFSFCIILLSSCSQDESLNNQTTSETTNLQLNSLDNIVILSPNGSEPDSVIQKRIAENPEKYAFDDSHSDLWIEENNLRSAGDPPLLVSGYDFKELIGTNKIMFYSDSQCDRRVYGLTTYVYKIYHYKKAIQVPKGATLILPPPSIMQTMSPMGWKPDAPGTFGYTPILVSTNSVHDTYHLVTEVHEFTHYISGRQMAPIDDPAYTVCNFYSPASYIMKYQYSLVNW